jgi:hypothetical protein
MYKAQKDQISVFGLRTQYGGGKTTGFALVYDSPEAMKKFEPTYRLVRVGQATKVERASRQQRAYSPDVDDEDGHNVPFYTCGVEADMFSSSLQASSARTDRRPFAERRRRRVPRRRRRNKRFTSQPCISSDRWGKGCGVYLPWAASATAMRVRPVQLFQRHEGRVVDGILDSARGHEGFAFMIFPPQYTSMKSMVFRVSDQKSTTAHVLHLSFLAAVSRFRVYQLWWLLKSFCL